MKRLALVLVFAAVGCGSAEDPDESSLPLCDEAPDAGAALVQTAEVKLNLHRDAGAAPALKLERAAELRPGLRPLARCVRR